ncbi:MAG: aldo/keto reductase [Ginsengibacter sp.]
MEYINHNNHSISKLTLGTVALGLEYGISNNEGKPSLEQSDSIISAAISAGINMLDTAATYGNAEEIIGGYFVNHPNDSCRIVTKFTISNENLISPEKAKAQVYASVKQSLKNLHTAKIYCVLYHKPEEQPMEKIIHVLRPIVEDLKNDGLIETAGISVFYPQEAASIIKEDFLQAVQLPINIMDTRLCDNGNLNELKQYNKLVFARSIFLQGLFFMNPDDLKGNLVDAKPFLLKLKEIAQQANLSVAELAFAYVRDLNGISSLIFGATEKSQVKENVELLKIKKLDPAFIRQIQVQFSKIPAHILIPSFWKES